MTSTAKIEYARFSAEDAMEASLDGDPITVSGKWVSRQCAAHGAEASEFFSETGIIPTDAIDAGKLFRWLGY
jgi:hypothetical protein